MHCYQPNFADFLHIIPLTQNKAANNLQRSFKLTIHDAVLASLIRSKTMSRTQTTPICSGTDFPKRPKKESVPEHDPNLNKFFGNFFLKNVFFGGIFFYCKLIHKAKG
jgi:hypothetical protein